MQTLDISDHVDEDDIPLCPLCDQPIFSYEPAAIGRDSINDVVCLIHEDCAE